MTTAELRASHPPSIRHNLHALEAQRWIDWLTLRIAPSAAAALISFSHLGSGGALIVLVSMLFATTLIERADLPLHLMPASRVLVGVVAPVLGVAGAALTGVAAGSPHPLAEYGTVLLGTLLVLALGVWLRVRLTRSVGARVAVIGSRDFAADFAAELAGSGITSYEVVGWISSNGPAEYRRLRWLGRLESVREAVVAEDIDLLVASSSPRDPNGSRIEDICGFAADECLDLPVRLITANQLYEEVLGHVPAGTIDAAWYRYIMHPRFHAAAPLSKRIFDLCLGTLIALFFAPVVALAALAVKLSDGGPVLYRQRRLGEFGERFEMIKLRTMRVDAESAGPQWAAAADPRITPVGHLLRRSHIDELPQLWNVLRGEMTLVGPRPERPEIVAGLEGRFAHYTRRHLVKPGIAGWAALRCGYAGSELGTAWKLCHDLFYIKRRSVFTDALILTETAFEIFRDAHRALRAPDQRFLIGDEARGEL